MRQQGRRVLASHILPRVDRAGKLGAERNEVGSRLDELPHVENDYDYLYVYIKAEHTVQRRRGRRLR
jgi:hypothetical protein